MYAQPQHQLVLTDAHAAALRTMITQWPTHPQRGDDGSAFTARTELLAALSAALDGSAVTLRAKSKYVPLQEILKTFRVTETTLRYWLKQKGMQTLRDGNRAYMARGDVDALRAWRISLSYPEPE